MNQKTAILLKRVARATNPLNWEAAYKDLKAGWLGTHPKLRGQRRTGLKANLALLRETA